jgi:hypothetical protein
MRLVVAEKVAAHSLVGRPGGLVPRARRTRPRALSMRVALPGGHVDARVLDVSYRGLSFELDRDALAVAPSTVLSDVALHDHGRLAVRIALEVRFVRPKPGGGVVCGARVVARNLRENARWSTIALASLHPGTDVGARYDRDVWGLFEDSGYFDLSGKAKGEFLHVRDAASYVTECLDRDPRVGYRVVWQKGDQVAASVSHVRAYAGTWLGHQMAKSKSVPLTREEGLVALRSLYERLYEPLLDSGEAQWLLGYCEAHVRWMRAAHHDFAKPRVGADAAIVPFRLFEARCDQRVDRPAGVDVGPATEVDRRRILKVVEATKPRPYREALDLVPARFDLEETTARWQGAGLERERHVLVARVGGVDVAAAIVEIAERGTNLFGLLDGVRLLPIRDVARETLEDACVALLAEAAEIYRRQGRESFVHHAEGEDDPSARHLRAMRDLGEGYAWIVSAGLGAEFLEHVRALTKG